MMPLLTPSMRPRGIPRGNPRAPPSPTRRVSSFNEAAGDSPRKLCIAGRAVTRLCETAFNEAAGDSPRKPPSSQVLAPATQPFNEAAGDSPRKHTTEEEPNADLHLPSMRPRGIPRGNLDPVRCDSERPCPFNEAAGDSPRKLRTPVAGRVRDLPPSMRPRGFPAETLVETRQVDGLAPAPSMRPRGIPRGNAKVWAWMAAGTGLQ